MRSLLLLLVAVPAFANPDETLDRTAISDGIAKVKAKIADCGTKTLAAGTVKVKVEVAPSGIVNTATVMATPDQALGACVAGVIKIATFRATVKGATFSYPFVFGGTPAEAPDPEALDRAAIAEGMAKIKPDVIACGATSKVRGTVKVKVAPAGTVTASTIVSSPDPALGECVAAAVKKGVFRKTVKGGTFTYPFVF